MTKTTIDYKPLHKNKEYYLRNKDSLLRKFEGQFILLHECEVVDHGQNGALLAQKAIDKYGVWNFCVQFCAKDEPKADVSHIIKIIHGA